MAELTRAELKAEVTSLRSLLNENSTALENVSNNALRLCAGCGEHGSITWDEFYRLAAGRCVVCQGRDLVAARAQALAYAADLRTALSDAATARIALGCLVNEHPARSASGIGPCDCCCCRQARAALGDTFTGQGKPPCQQQWPIADPRAEVLAELAETRAANATLRAEREALRACIEFMVDHVSWRDHIYWTQPVPWPLKRTTHIEELDTDYGQPLPDPSTLYRPLSAESPQIANTGD